MHRMKAIAEYILVDKNQLPRPSGKLRKSLAFNRGAKLNGDAQGSPFAPGAFPRPERTKFPRLRCIPSKIVNPKHQMHIESRARTNVPERTSERHHSKAWPRGIGLHRQQGVSPMLRIDAVVRHQDA